MPEATTFSLSAQVYALDKTQKWAPLTSDVVLVQFLYNDSTNSTRIFAKENDKTVVNSAIVPNMQYRRPSDTFVQWFDSQHILFGLNLTSVADAEGFEREFEMANGKRPRPQQNGGGGVPSSAGNKPGSSQLQKDTASGSYSSIPSAKKVEIYNSGSNSSVGGQGDAKSLKSGRSTSNDQLTELTSNQNKAADARVTANLKARIKELELQNLTLDADRNSLSETIASQTKTISGLQNQIKQLEADIDKLKSAFQQNASNVNIWKQQLQTYQQVNDQLTSRMNELHELYDSFGDILKRSQEQG